MTLVKICGNTTPSDVLAAAEAGADFVGIIFAESRRRVDAATGASIVRALGAPLAAHEFDHPPPARAHSREDVQHWFRHGAEVINAYLAVKRPLTIGVFADQAVEEVNAIAEEAGVDLVQLSGDESWEDCLLITKQVVQVVHVGPIDTPADPLEQVKPGFALAMGLDAAHGPYRGGTGRTFDWEVARQVAERVPMMLAGGLRIDNVREAIERVRPWIVDVSSGTETDGRKDHAKVRAFIEAVRATDVQEATA